jgi:hypothetical protein
VEAANGQCRERLATPFAALVASGAVRLPVGAAGWDRAALPPVPEWMPLAAPAETVPTFDVHSVPWASELALVPSLPCVEYASELFAIRRPRRHDGSGCSTANRGQQVAPRDGLALTSDPAAAHKASKMALQRPSRERGKRC